MVNSSDISTLYRDFTNALAMGDANTTYSKLVIPRTPREQSPQIIPDLERGLVFCPALIASPQGIRDTANRARVPVCETRTLRIWGLNPEE